MPENTLAFPTAVPGVEPSYGMTLRDYFAAAALTGLLAQTDRAEHATDMARQSYVVADAMLEEREEPA